MVRSEGDVDVRARIAEALRSEPVSLRTLSGGCVAEVYRAEMPGGPDLVIKVDGGSDPKLDREGFMLETLAAADAPVPRVIACRADLLAIEHVENDGRKSAEGEAELGAMVADLHGHGNDRYGLERDTLIGPLDQPNGWDDHWPRFYAQGRLAPMADQAERGGSLPRGTHDRIARICERIDELIPKPNPPSLIHGDLWAGNALWHRGRPAAMIDPAVYYADREVELAFIDLMGGMGRSFWQAYEERRPIRPGFWEGRCDLYKLYPLLVHAVLFGGGYGRSVDGIAGRLVG